MYVAPQADRTVEVNEEELISSGLLGSWREEIGWGQGSGESMVERDTTPFF